MDQDYQQWSVIALIQTQPRAASGAGRWQGKPAVTKQILLTARNFCVPFLTPLVVLRCILFEGPPHKRHHRRSRQSAKRNKNIIDKTWTSKTAAAAATAGRHEQQQQWEPVSRAATKKIKQNTLCAPRQEEVIREAHALTKETQPKKVRRRRQSQPKKNIFWKAQKRREMSKLSKVMSKLSWATLPRSAYHLLCLPPQPRPNWVGCCRVSSFHYIVSFPQTHGKRIERKIRRVGCFCL